MIPGPVPRAPGESFTRAFLGATAYRVALGLGAMACSVAGGRLGSAIGGGWAPFAGAMIGLFTGFALVVRIQRFRRARQASTATGRDPSATHSLQEPG